MSKTAISSRDIHQTSDYDTFVTLPGNRAVVKSHVNYLKSRMEENGNLTNFFPITVNRNMEIIDGGHRLAALKLLGWPVCYTIVPDLSISNVRAINIAHRNWTWQDYAISYSELGNENYTRLLTLNEEFDLPYSVLMAYSGQAKGKESKKASFTAGDMKLTYEQLENARILLTMLEEIRDIVGPYDRDFAISLGRIMQSPNYDHKRMVHKMTKWSRLLETCHTQSDYLRTIEDIFNAAIRDENERVRLF